jgi:antitoxin component YwqK of YwqJK toxin-antitoxin module
LIESFAQCPNLSEQKWVSLSKRYSIQGEILCKIEFNSGKQHGFAREFNSSGQVKSETTYINGLRHGIESEWYDNGKRKLENIFEFDVLMKSTTWSESGDILDEYERPSDDVLYKMVEKEKKREV